MKRYVFFVLLLLALAMAPSNAIADPGPPGSTFPESPDTNVTNACLVITTAPTVGGGTSNNATSFGIIMGIFVDACTSG